MGEERGSGAVMGWRRVERGQLVLSLRWTDPPDRATGGGTYENVADKSWEARGEAEGAGEETPEETPASSDSSEAMSL